MKRKGLLLTVLLLLAMLLVPAAYAADKPVETSNLNRHYYGNAGRFALPVTSTLAAENGGYLRVENVGDSLVVEQYDQDLCFVSSRELALELPIYGGVYLCDDYNFVVSGQMNLEEDDNREVIRVTRYSKDWVRQDAAGLYGANTIIPFDAGSVRFARSGDILYIRTSHEMYTTGDGLNHQANVMLSIRISDMTVTDELTAVLNRNYGYVSHSFNQFVQVDGTALLAVDHGDALPRSVVLFRYGQPAGQETFYGRTEYVEVLPIIDGTTHYNDTGVALGGFEYSTTHYLVAGNSADQTVEGQDLMYAHRNIFVTATPKNEFYNEATVVRWLTSYAEEDDVEISPPHLLKIANDRFFLTWTENDVLHYCFLNGKGEPEGEIYVSQTGQLSDCVPILHDNAILWYVTDASAPVFYKIDLAAPETVHSSHTHQYSYSCVKAPTQSAAGKLSVSCAECGEAFTVTMPKLSETDYTCEVLAKPGHLQEGKVRYTWKETAYGKWTFEVTQPACTHQFQTESYPASVLSFGVRNEICAVCGYVSKVERTLCRLSGADRCATAYAAADMLKELLVAEKFDNIIIASGSNFADALAGSYLAKVKSAPILLYMGRSEQQNLNYIAENLAPGGTVYILGGTAAVPAKVDAQLQGYTVKRLAGDTRYDTNLKILEEAGVNGEEILVATGRNFADSLSASATGLPILLVDSNKSLSAAQQAFLAAHSDSAYTILGGTAAVSEKMAAAIENAAGKKPDRVYGARRENTSVLVAQRYFEAPRAALVAYSQNFPDGLCGGPVAYAAGVPLLLTRAGAESIAAEYIQAENIQAGAVLGGTAAVSHATAEKVFGLKFAAAE